MFTIPRFIFTEVSYHHKHPASNNHYNRQVNIIDEETGLPSPLKPPEHRIRAEKLAIGINLLSVSNFTLNTRTNDIFGLIGYFLVGRSIEEDEDSEKSYTLVHVLRLDLIGKHRARGNLGTTE
jgi:hypothetical protein